MSAITIDIKDQSFITIKDLSICFLLSVVISLFAHVVIPLPFTPVPIATQNILCLFMGLVLGKKKGALTVFFFLIQGLVGFPVFSKGGAGIAWLLGPTGGYLVGYLMGAYITGLIVENKKTLLRAFLALGVGSLTIYAFGVLRLSMMIGTYQAIILGMIPFLLGDLIKIGVVLQAYRFFNK